MTQKFRCLTEIEEKICRETGIGPEGMCVQHADDRYIVLLHHKTGNEIMLILGERYRREYGNRGKRAG